MCVCVCVSKLFELTKYKVLKDKGEHTFLFTSLIPLYNKVDMFSNNWFSTLNSFYRRKGTERFLSKQEKARKLCSLYLHIENGVTVYYFCPLSCLRHRNADIYPARECDGRSVRRVRWGDDCGNNGGWQRRNKRPGGHSPRSRA